MHSLYLIVNLASVIVPFIFSFHPKIKFYKQFKAVWPALLLPAMVFVGWDVLFTARGIWGFNPRYLIGVYVFNLPLEEVLFFICIPYACLFTFYSLTLFYQMDWPTYKVRVTSIIISVILLIVALLHLNNAYTSTTFIITAAMLLLFTFVFKVNWLGSLFRVYPVLLIPFFIVNGILTGTGIEEPVVWYNEAEIIGIRLLTIPIEDVVYGFLLIFSNILLFYRLSGANKSV